jgi:hypothetical protein
MPLEREQFENGGCQIGLENQYESTGLNDGTVWLARMHEDASRMKLLACCGHVGLDLLLSALRTSTRSLIFVFILRSACTARLAVALTLLVLVFLRIIH